MWPVVYLPDASQERDKQRRAGSPQPAGITAKGRRSPWRALYRQVGSSFVIAAVCPEAKVDQREFTAACQRAVARLEELEEE
jgi:hypothetical protein